MGYRIVVIAFILWLAGTGSRLWPQTEAKITQRLTRLTESTAGDQTVSAWLFFSDKGPLSSRQLKSIETSLNHRAYERRLRNRKLQNLVDEYDLPVYSRYLQAIRPYVEKVRHRSRWLNAVSVEIRESNIREIARFPFVEKIDLLYKAIAPEPLAAPLPGAAHKSQGTHALDYGFSFEQNAQINVIPLHDLGYDGSGVLVAMFDAGFNTLNHQALDHLKIFAVRDFVNGGEIVEDGPGRLGTGDHGTITLSTLAGFQEGQLIGPAYGADFILCKTEITDSNGVDYERHIEEDHWVAAAEWVDSLGADIISSSLGYLNGFTNGDSNYTWENMDGQTAIVTRAAEIAASRGILVVNSAGNEGPAVPPANTLIGPADGEHVLAVGSVAASGNRSSFSSMGPTADGRIKPDVMARGSATYCASPWSPIGYTSASGTSLSCPLVAGAAALVLQVNPQLSNRQIMEALKSTASNAAQPDNELGWGIINAYEAAFVFTGLREEKIPPVITRAELYPLFPNPFNPAATIRYELPREMDIRLTVHNILGQELAVLTSGRRTAGEHRMVWKAGNLASGIYYIVLKAGGQQKVQRAVLLK